jgi:hypothetical protein
MSKMAVLSKRVGCVSDCDDYPDYSLQGRDVLDASAASIFRVQYKGTQRMCKKISTCMPNCMASNPEFFAYLAARFKLRFVQYNIAYLAT